MSVVLESCKTYINCKSLLVKPTSLICLTNTVTNPWAVMIEFSNTFVTTGAMLRADGSPQ